MSDIKVRIRNGLKKNLITGLGGATEGKIRGQQSDIISNTDGGVVDLAGNHLLVEQTSPASMNILINKGICYIKNADFDEYDSDSIKYWEIVVSEIQTLAIDSNSSGSTRNDLICIKFDTAIEPDEFGDLVATAVIVKGTPGAGIPATPDNHYKLSELEVINGATTIPTAKITDSREQLTIKTEFGGGGTSPFGSNDFITREIPSGTVDGSNKDFTLANIPVAGTEEVEIDGKGYYVTNDYTISGAVISFVLAPVTGSEIRVSYQKTVSTTGNADTVDGFHANSTPTANNIPVLDANALLPSAAIPQLNSPKLNENVALTSTSTELNLLHGQMGAWTAFTSTITALSGSFTTVSGAGYYIQIGKTVHFTLTITITNNGTASGSIFATLPVTAKRSPNGMVYGREDAINGKMLVGRFNDTTHIEIGYFDNSGYAGGTGLKPIISGTYEAA